MGILIVILDIVRKIKREANSFDFLKYISKNIYPNYYL